MLNYLPADKYIIFNDNDEDLYPIKYLLPEPPTPELIDGYGLPPDEQYWRPKPMPYNLRKLNNDKKLKPSEKIKILESSQEHYKEEIEYIHQEWDRVENGYWLYLNGKPYYITGDNYFYLQWWPIEGVLPEFRMRDREFWLFVEMTDKDSYCMGFNYPKGRREGATTRVSAKRLRKAITTPYAHLGLQSKDDLHAKEVHQRHVWDIFRYHTPFFFTPIWDEDLQNKSVINFYAPDSKTHVDFNKQALQTIISFRPSSKTAYDGLKLKHLHVDEAGKVVEVDVNERWAVQKECLVEGSTIIGKAIFTSTVEEMESQGGKEFKKLCDQSHYDKRNQETGRTISGLYNFFIPSHEGYGGEVPPHYKKKYGVNRWIDKFGFDVLDPDTLKPLAYQYLKGMLQAFLDADDMEGWIDQTRKYPLRWKDCWKRKAATNNFDIEVIEKRLDYYRHGNPDVQRGDFMWDGGVEDTRVIWTPSSTGRFILSYQFAHPNLTNAQYKEDGLKIPANTMRFVAGGDPFKFAITKSGKKSQGGGAVFWRFEPTLDHGKELSEWQSNRFVCSYLFRPPEMWQYCEDMLMMCVWFGCKIYPEINVPAIRDHFVKRGYGAYLLYSINDKGKAEGMPGEHTQSQTIEAIFRAYQHYIKHHGHRERHTDILEQCKDIEWEMGDFDLFAAGGYALLADQVNTFTPRETQKADISDFVPSYNYSDN